MNEKTILFGSGAIYKQGGTMINILPVHSRHRGKLFLAEDSKLNDPSILEQIK